MQASNNPTQSWNSAPIDPFPSWYREQLQTQNAETQKRNDLMSQQIEQQKVKDAETKGRADSLYQLLNQRATQGLQVNANDPIIRFSNQ